MAKKIEKLILTLETEEVEMLYDLRNGKKKGTTTYIGEIDPCWTWRESELNIISGYSNEGKSLLLKQLCLIKALEENKKFIFYSPEDYPASEFFQDMIHTISGKSTDKDNHNFISEELYQHCFDLIKDNFTFLYIQPPNNTIEEIVNSFEEILELHPDIYGIIVDPYIKVSRSKLAPERDDLYGAFFMNTLGDFTRMNNLCAFLVMHQLTPKKNEGDKLYPKPSMYSIKSGGTFADTADNVLIVQRPYYAKDKINPMVIFGSDKIKKQKLVGVPQEIEIQFNPKTNRYTDMNANDLYNFDKHLPGYKTKRTF